MKIPNNIIVLDLEATCCWSNDNLPENAIHETIEIGAVRIINGKIDVNLPQQSLEIVDSSIQGIPYSWKTEVSIRVWT